MRLVRGPVSVSVLPGEVPRAQARARALLEEAAAEAASLRESARREAEAERARVREEERARAVAELAAERAGDAEQRQRWLEEQQGQLVSLGLEVARAVLGREAEGGEGVVRDVARKVLLRARRARRVVLRVCPEELEVVRAGLPSWLPAGMNPEVLAAEADPSVERGGALLESDVGRFDGRLTTQLELLRRALAGGRA